MLGVFPAIASFTSGTYTVTRRGASVYGSDGILDAFATSTVSIEASVQPMSGEDVRKLPEGARVEDGVTVWSTTELKAKGASNFGDLISIGGKSYEVVSVENWNTLGGYYVATALKEGH